MSIVDLFYKRAIEFNRPDDVGRVDLRMKAQPSMDEIAREKARSDAASRAKDVSKQYNMNGTEAVEYAKGEYEKNMDAEQDAFGVRDQN